jgi:NTP pyrophosphatase (non-canonical NTP hydrolase)
MSDQHDPGDEHEERHMEENIEMTGNEKTIVVGVAVLQQACYGASKTAGWWKDPDTGEDLDVDLDKRTRSSLERVGLKISLIHSEVSEALEGKRKNKKDEHLPHRPSVEVELADAIIRICDLSGALGIDLAGAIVEKMRYNAVRPDHKLENRKLDGGKTF